MIWKNKTGKRVKPKNTGIKFEIEKYSMLAKGKRKSKERIELPNNEAIIILNEYYTYREILEVDLSK